MIRAKSLRLVSITLYPSLKHLRTADTDESFPSPDPAIANEIALICEKLGLDAVELIHAANTHYPRNSIPVPSPGVGGACLTKDPYLLYASVKKKGYAPNLILETRKLNEGIVFNIKEETK